MNPIRVTPSLVLLWGAVSLAACNKEAEPAPQRTSAPVAEMSSKPSSPAPPPNQPTVKDDGMKTAGVGDPAPDFTLPDLDGKQVRLADYKGKIVVLEWFNPECPFVKNSHTKGSLIDTAKKLQDKGVVYLGINSGAPGKQGHGVEANREGKKRFSLGHPILLDETGDVGRAYGASNTPHIFVINEGGVLVYRGAVDNSPDGEGASPEGGKLVNYLLQAVDDVLAKKPVSVPETKAYGCSVKYAK